MYVLSEFVSLLEQPSHSFASRNPGPDRDSAVVLCHVAFLYDYTDFTHLSRHSDTDVASYYADQLCDIDIRESLMSSLDPETPRMTQKST